MDWKFCYPRPQWKRTSFFALSDGWTCNGAPIRIPFAPQSKLAAFDGEIGTKLTYRVTFSLPAGFVRETTLLHFGACDQTCTVFLNGKSVGSHRGGYLPFSFDITEVLADENTLVVEAVDEGGIFYPYGKQSAKPHGMWYTAISGIWQTVWVESVATDYLRSAKITPSCQDVTFALDTDATEVTLAVTLPSGNTLTETHTERTFTLSLPEVRNWCPEDPYLYRTVLTTSGGDRVETYFALREVTMEQVGGKPRICLNHQPIFLSGVLDQGYFEDGIYLPEDPKEYERDVLRMKELGYNCLRKHIKIEPAVFYYYCDLHGMMVWQDFVNNGKYRFFWQTLVPNFLSKRHNDRTEQLAPWQEYFLVHARETQACLHNIPSIVGYTIFNEGWGQFNADAAYREFRSADPTRIYDATSGWFAQQESDLASEHIYFANKVLSTKTGRPIFLSECGGYACVIEGHDGGGHSTYGYGSADGEEALTARMEQMYREMVIPSIPNGLCGCIYTQLSDVEGERNGLYTYDRAVCKVNIPRMAAMTKEVATAFAKDVTEHGTKPY